MREHPEPVSSVTLATYDDVDPVLSIGGVAVYFDVTKGLAAKWTLSSDWPEPFAEPPSGTLYVTSEVIAWGKAHERSRDGGPREGGDPRPPSRRGPLPTAEERE
jgi:hypothetical protein